ncbi:T9SS type A sorting domain-containing protein [Hymenobacter negativus]|uniref:T9SS type A sorting domain-containing protein n=1 Tax=Hymenobacter negativus TaxID=2795026 RepID=A0ABS3QN45_9BACT|nr:T9SS type A sorting domain-containing protein [Hymenobacter negativus]MBO2012486.1 T9SS type A sorting domain-containing protein [Hymenobacter negativus]
MRNVSPPVALVVVLVLAGATTARAQDLTNTGTQLTLEAGATVVIPDALINQAGATLITGGTVTVGGNFTNDGTVLPASGRLVFTGATDQTVKPGGATLANLEVRNTGPAGSNRVLLLTDLTVTQQLTLTTGLLRTAPTATLRLPAGAALTGEAPGRYVQGNLLAERAAVAGTTPVDFGNSFVLNPNGNALGTVRVTRHAGLQAAGTTYATNPATPGQKSIDRFWTVLADQAPTTAVETALSWLADDDNGLSFGQGQVYQLPAVGAGWQALGSPASGTARRLTASTTSLAGFTVSTPASPLPVELLAFTAERQGTDGLLRWTTASEKNNDRFEIESSPDGRTYHRIATVAGQGSSAQRHDYSLPDSNLARYAAAIIYYRLRQVDRDGTFAYSPVRTIQVPAERGLSVQAYPQPFATDLSLLIRTDEAGPVTIMLHDAVGRALLTRRAALLPGSSTVSLPEAAALPSGVYVLRITQNNHRRTVKVVRE